MSKRLELRLIGGPSTFAFDVEGEWFPSIEPSYKTAADPPQLETLREVWEFRRCRIVPADGTTTSLWNDFIAFRGQFEDRANYPTALQLIEDPDGVATVRLTLGPPDYENFVIESVEGEQDPQVEDASYNSTATVTIRASAVRKFADANGIVAFEQEVSVSYPFGCRVLEWSTTIITEEGESAVDKAKQFATIPIAALGGDHSYDTNGPDGIDYQILDADEQNTRIPTQVDAISRIRQWGSGVGASMGQGSPSDFVYTITTRTENDETATTTFASARGPNAKQWVLAKKPDGDIAETEEVEGKMLKTYSARWTQKRDDLGGGGGDVEQKGDETRVTLTGGKRVQLWRGIAGGRQPILNEGAFTPWVAEVSIVVFRTGTEEITLPGLLPSPWILDPNESSETQSVIEERSSSTSQNRYRREATLVYRSASPPPASGHKAVAILNQIRNAPRVESYYL